MVTLGYNFVLILSLFYGVFPENNILGANAKSFLLQESADVARSKAKDMAKGIAEAYALKVWINGKYGWSFVGSGPTSRVMKEFIGFVVISGILDF